MTAQSKSPPQADPATERVSEDAFQELLARRAQSLLSISGELSERPAAEITRPLLGELLHQSTEVEELLDAYGARTNERWHRFRSLAAAIKLFADVSYELLHIRHVLPSYRLRPLDDDFIGATERALSLTGEVLFRAAGEILHQARELSLPVPQGPAGDAYVEHLPPGRLPKDRARRTTETVAETVARLATAFLNLASESHMLQAVAQARPEEYPTLTPEPISEESLRFLQDRFHNCQSLYDTYVSGTDTEALDADLPVLRGHVSIVFHLLKTATAFAHYYERHVKVTLEGTPDCGCELISADDLLSALMDYSITYAERYVSLGEELCRTMLKRYAEIGRVEVPVPRYRGFHVRPSTLVSKIVLHYGSDVRMELGGESYDASSPLEIFRVNEKINAQKRRWLASEVAQLPAVRNGRPDDIAAAVRHVVMTLAEQGKIVIYEQPLQVAEDLTDDGRTVLEQVISEIARLQATGRIDIQADLSVALVGDKRVLADIRLLAENGYGEDNFGNNIALPEKLAYLRR
jgi:hypothetical protein